MAPVVCSDDNSIDHKHLLFEASILHRIPPELFIQSSSSTRYLQSVPNGKSCRSWPWNRRKDRKEERLRKLARFNAELTSKLMARETPAEDTRITWDTSNNKEDSKENENPVEREELLLDIALKTMVLMHHNQQLQNKINALQIETRNFVTSCHNVRNDQHETKLHQ